jgi:uncharacterized protein (DUF169 family)
LSIAHRDYSVFDKFRFERKPVAVKFLPTRPEGVERLSKALNFCEMLGEAHTSAPFYAQREDFHCIEPFLLGMEDPEPIYISGLFGGQENLFKEARACRKMYEYLPMMLKGSVNYVAFGAIDQAPFDPDVLVLTATLEQAQTLLRSIGYSTGEAYGSKTTPVAACAWIYLYPILSDTMNYTVSGLGLGMQAVKALPPGLFVISVPWTKLSTMMENLREMTIGPRGPAPGGNAHRERVAILTEQLRKKIAE